MIPIYPAGAHPERKNEGIEPSDLYLGEIRGNPFAYGEEREEYIIMVENPVAVSLPFFVNGKVNQAFLHGATYDVASIGDLYSEEMSGIMPGSSRFEIRFQTPANWTNVGGGNLAEQIGDGEFLQANDMQPFEIRPLVNPLYSDPWELWLAFSYSNEVIDLEIYSYYLINAQIAIMQRSPEFKKGGSSLPALLAFFLLNRLLKGEE